MYNLITMQYLIMSDQFMKYMYIRTEDRCMVQVPSHSQNSKNFSLSNVREVILDLVFFQNTFLPTSKFDYPLINV
jgi:hypothetical protein